MARFYGSRFTLVAIYQSDYQGWGRCLEVSAWCMVLLSRSAWLGGLSIIIRWSASYSLTARTALFDLRPRTLSINDHSFCCDYRQFAYLRCSDMSLHYSQVVCSNRQYSFYFGSALFHHHHHLSFIKSCQTQPYNNWEKNEIRMCKTTKSAMIRLFG